jgi:hypothetical protein
LDRVRNFVGFGESDLDGLAAEFLLERGRGALADHGAVVDDGDGVGEVVGLFELLSGEQNGRALADQLGEEGPQLLSGGRVEPGARLVEQEDFGSADQAGTDIEAAAHAARVSSGRSAASVSDSCSRTSEAAWRACRAESR